MERLKFRVEPSFWIFIAVAAVFKHGYFAAMYSIAMILHETAHYVAARRLFYRCTEIKICIFGAVLYGDFSDVGGTDRIKIALAGPFCNLCVCLVCLALWWLFPETYYFSETFFTANLGMACVNMLPCYPLDGGRVLTGIFEKKQVKNALKLTQVLTYAFSALLFCIFCLSVATGVFLYNVGIFAVCLFSGVLSKSGGECYVKSTFIHGKRFLKKGMEKKILVFDGDSTLSDVAKRMQGNFLYCLEVVDRDMNVCQSYDIAKLEEFVIGLPADTRLKDLKS